MTESCCSVHDVAQQRTGRDFREVNLPARIPSEEAEAPT
jgi:hypothetical protein